MVQRLHTATSPERDAGYVYWYWYPQGWRRTSERGGGAKGRFADGWFGKNLKHHQLLLSLAMQHATYRLCHFHGTCYDESVAGLVLELQLNLIAP